VANPLTIINALLVAIALPSFYTINYEISLMMIAIIAKAYDLQLFPHHHKVCVTNHD
jgi:hypothetical protein